MGSSSYNSDRYTHRLMADNTAGRSSFAHDDDIRTGQIAAGAHATLDPKLRNAADEVIRESVDSEVHPNSVAIVALFDVTGSMHSVPRQLKDKLNRLPTVLTSEGYVVDPHILFGAIGDAYSDRVPLQIGQFEAGNEMNNDLLNIYLESGGGGGVEESYELAMYFMARHTRMDCLTKRGKKGYLFIFGDEKPYGVVKASQVSRVIGDDIGEDIPTDQILAELREKFEVFWIYPKQGSYIDRAEVMDPLRRMFGQNLLILDNAGDACELVSATIGVSEGHDINDVNRALRAVEGADGDAVERAIDAVHRIFDGSLPESPHE